MPLVERNHELSILNGIYSSLQETQGSAVIVEGAPTLGKTSLLADFSQGVVQSGGSFLSSFSSRAERTCSLGTLTQLFEAAELSGETMERVDRLLSAGSSATSPSPGLRGGIPPEVLRGLHGVLIALSARGPLVLAVDDAHQADAPTLDFLLYLVRRIHTSRIMVLVAADRRPRQDYLRFRSELLTFGHSRRLALAPLSAEGTARIAADRLGGRAAALATELWNMSGGNPLLVRALLEDQERRVAEFPAVGEEPREVSAGSAFVQAVHDCLQRCGASMVRFAGALAVLGEDADTPVLEALLRNDTASMSRVVGVLNEVGLLAGNRFRSDSLRNAVLEGMSSSQRIDVRRRAAVVLHELARPSEVVARYLVLADHGLEPWAVAALESAAEHALLSGDLELTARYLRRALADCPGDTLKRARLQAALARAEWWDTPNTAVRHVPELIRHSAEGRLDERAVTELLGYLAWQGKMEEAVAVTEQADGPRGPARKLPHHTSDPRRGHSRRLWLCAFFPELRDRLRPHPSPPLQAAMKSVRALEEHNAIAALESALTGQADEKTLMIAEQVLQGASRDDGSVSAAATCLYTLIYLGRVDRADSWCGALADATMKRGGRLWRALLSAIHADVQARQGRMTDASASAREALALVPVSDWGVAIGLPLAIAVESATARGCLGEAESHLRTPVPDTMLQTLFGVRYLRARGRYHTATERHQAALGDFRTCGELLERWRLDKPFVLPWRVDAAQALLASGALREARELVYKQLARIGPNDSLTQGAALRVLAESSDLAERTAILREAADALQAGHDRYELFQTVVASARAHRALGDVETAQEYGAAAQRLAEFCGVPVHASPGPSWQVVSRGPRAVGTSATTTGHLLDRLSEAERRVAQLASAGRSNRQIAEELFITVSTVEQHLTRVYRKLKTRHRTELRGKLQSDAPPVMSGGECQVG